MGAPPSPPTAHLSSPTLSVVLLFPDTGGAAPPPLHCWPLRLPHSLPYFATPDPANRGAPDSGAAGKKQG
jgi:hypothetical protein